MVSHSHQRESRCSAAQICITHIVGCDNQLDDILGILIKDFYCGPWDECSKILWRKKNKTGGTTDGLRF